VFLVRTKSDFHRKCHVYQVRMRVLRASLRLTSGERKALVYIFRSATLSSASREWPEPRACDRTLTHACQLEERERLSACPAAASRHRTAPEARTPTVSELAIARAAVASERVVVNACVERVRCS